MGSTSSRSIDAIRIVITLTYDREILLRYEYADGTITTYDQPYALYGDDSSRMFPFDIDTMRRCTRYLKQEASLHNLNPSIHMNVAGNDIILYVV